MMSHRVTFRYNSGFLPLAQFIAVCLLLTAVYRVGPVVSYISDANRMRDWVEVPATIDDVDYRRQTPDGNSRITASYRYTYDGVDYQGSRVDVANSEEVFGRFQQRLAGELTKHAEDKTPVAAYVNPAQPDEAVLDRRFLWTVLAYRLFLFLILAICGGIMFAAMSYARRRHKYQVQAQRLHPDEPWLWRPDWANLLIRSSSFEWPWALVALAALYLSVVLPISLLALVESGRQITTVPGVVLILIGVALLNAAVWQWTGAQTLKGATFRMSAVPGVIGGSLAGGVILRKKFPEDATFRAALECVQTTRVHSQNDRANYREKILWRDSTAVQKTLSAADAHSTAIPVYFAIPFGCQPTRPARGVDDKETIHWNLKVGPETDSFGKYAQFEVPVFKTAESSPDLKLDTAVMAPYAKVVDAAEALAGIRYHSEPIPGGERLSFSYYQHVLLAGALVALTACGAAIAAIFYFELHPAWSLLPGILALLVLIGAAQMLLWSGSLEIRGGRVMIRSGYAGRGRRYEVTRSDVLALDIEREHTANERDFFRIDVKFAVPIPEVEIDELKSSENPEFVEGELIRRRMEYAETLTVVKRLEGRERAHAVRRWLSEKLRVCDVQLADAVPPDAPQPESSLLSSAEELWPRN